MLSKYDLGHVCFKHHENQSADTPELPLPIVSLNTQYIGLSVRDLPLHSTSFCTLMPKKAEED